MFASLSPIVHNNVSFDVLFGAAPKWAQKPSFQHINFLATNHWKWAKQRNKPTDKITKPNEHFWSSRHSIQLPPSDCYVNWLGIESMKKKERGLHTKTINKNNKTPFFINVIHFSFFRARDVNRIVSIYIRDLCWLLQADFIHNTISA